MSEIFTLAGIAIVAAGFVILLKQYKPEYAFGAALAAGILLLLYTITIFSGIIDEIESLVSSSGIESENFGILLRCLGICMVTKIASETCKDCGQGSISSKIDLAGKVAILVSSMPLFSEIIGIIKNLIEV
ncbi:MAG: stage III sporulation protein AD [Oscillospiraceae bacterium]|nr:stage III sporulation protein AD [Oscillospiraceae bacterium]